MAANKSRQSYNLWKDNTNLFIVFWKRRMDFVSILLIWNLGSLVIAIDGTVIRNETVKLQLIISL